MTQVDFWQERYESQDTPWDLGGPSPHFKALLAEKPSWLKPGKMAAFGVGRGHDAALFAQNSFSVTGFDYAEGAVAEANARYGALARFVRADIFDLADPASPEAGQYDYLLEHTCFCAIDPRDRPRYVESAVNILKPGGYLIGIFWEHGQADGPPFNTTVQDLESCFGRDFTSETVEDRKPARDRQGVERLTVLRKLPSPGA